MEFEAVEAHRGIQIENVKRETRSREDKSKRIANRQTVSLLPQSSHNAAPSLEYD